MSCVITDSESGGCTRSLQWCHDVARGWLHLPRHCSQVPPCMEYEHIMGNKSGLSHKLVCICAFIDSCNYLALFSDCINCTLSSHISHVSLLSSPSSATAEDIFRCHIKATAIIYYIPYIINPMSWPCRITQSVSIFLSTYFCHDMSRVCVSVWERERHYTEQSPW